MYLKDTAQLGTRQPMAVWRSSRGRKCCFITSLQRNLNLCMSLIQHYWKGIWDLQNPRVFWVSETNNIHFVFYTLSTHHVIIKEICASSPVLVLLPLKNNCWLHTVGNSFISWYIYQFGMMMVMMMILLGSNVTKMKMQGHKGFCYLFMIQFSKNWNIAMKAICTSWR